MNETGAIIGAHYRFGNLAFANLAIACVHDASAVSQVSAPTFTLTLRRETPSRDATVPAHSALARGRSRALPPPAANPWRRGHAGAFAARSRAAPGLIVRRATAAPECRCGRNAPRSGSRRDGEKTAAPWRGRNAA